MEKAFDNTKYEGALYKKWEEAEAFAPEVNPDGKPFTIMMPPPNANDPLHVGHAMFLSLEDILIRYHRMKGDAALWLPGTDHAGIETQFVFEKKLQKQGKSRFNFDRDTLYQMIWDYVQENSGIAVEQMKRLGSSADWSRFRFMLEPEIVDEVLGTFERLYSDELIYRDLRLVNYCTKCGTGYSELELVHKELNDAMFYVKYELLDSDIERQKDKKTTWLRKDGDKTYIVVATVRPEPIMIDTHLAVHPEDEARGWLVGRKVLNPISSIEMEIIADEHADPEKGTGIVKLTPGHDPNDFEVAKRHDLPIVQGIGFDGKMLENAGEFAGLRVEEARKKVAAYLSENGMMDRVDEKYVHNVGTCYKCGRVIEPLPMAQWFVKVDGMAKDALKALDDGETRIHGTGREKVLRHWLENLKDWNISRQIVWGIRMPVWYEIGEGTNMDIQIGFLNEEGKFTKGQIGDLLKEYSFEEIANGLQTLMAPMGSEYVLAREKPGEGQWLQETDTFDTWFSSGQWPVTTLKRGKEGDFEKYYPTSVMETGYDILTFWVMRMMLLGIYMTGKSPFKDVYLHGLVRDEKGQKMSKSKGNVVNPIELVDKYGADAVRMALVMSTTPGQDSAVGEAKVKGMRNMANKIWNAGRFVLMQRETEVVETGEYDEEFHEKLRGIVAEVTKLLEDLKIGLAAEVVHNEFWHWYCDVCIEQAKGGKLSSEASEEGMRTFLKLLHPFMPFVSEAVWGELGYEGNLIVSEWPKS